MSSASNVIVLDDRQGANQESMKLGFLLLGYTCTVLAAAAQIYFLMRAIYDMDNAIDIPSWQIVGFAFFFFFFSVLFLTRYTVLLLFAFMEAAKKPNLNILKNRELPLVSIIIPAYNEQNNVEATIRSALAVQYAHKEVIVVDDGSTDDTLVLAQQYAAQVPDQPLRVFSKANGGKASALNYAYARSEGDYVLSMDADSELSTDSVERLVARIENTSHCGCAGQVRIQNTNGVMTYLQHLEYVLMNGTGRMFQSFFSTVLVAPGPISLFKREALEDMMSIREIVPTPAHVQTVPGPWESDTFAEDAKLSMALLASGHGMVYEPTALCYTQSPLSTQDLFNQRYRWVRGNIQAARASWNLWAHVSDRRPNLGLWLIWFIVETVLWPLIDILSMLIFAYMLIITGGMSSVVYWYFVLLTADLCAAAFAAVSSRQSLNVVMFVPLYRAFYGILLEINALVSIADEARSARMRW